MTYEKMGSPRAAYVHVPFCHQRCPYCNFTVAIDRSDWIERYLCCLETELRSLGSPHKVNTIFIGGGTPTLLEANALERLLASIAQFLPLNQDGEWSIEANPNDLTDTKCDLLKTAGINRISIGGQSFDDRKLNQLGRSHNRKSLIDAIKRSQFYFDNVSLDLIFGAPQESLDIWKADLDSALSLDIPHISTYGLTYEKGASFWSQLQKGELHPVAELDELEMYNYAIDFLVSAGYEHYEVSNFARPSFRCRHNQTYWNLEPWFAFGPGAAGFVNGVRTINHRSTSKYLQLIEESNSAIAETEKIDWAQWTRERFVFGMRQMHGIDISRLESEGEPRSLSEIQNTINRHIKSHWLIREGSIVRLTRHGLAISDSLWPDYL